MSGYTFRRNRNWGGVALGCLGYLALMAAITLVSAFVVTVIWGWIVPTVFPSAVELGALPASMSIGQAIKLSILFSILGLTSASSSGTKKGASGSLGEQIAVGILAFVFMLPFLAILVLISGFFISLVWAWVIPDVFSGAVAMGLLPASLSLGHAILLSLLFSVLGLSRKTSSSSSND